MAVYFTRQTGTQGPVKIGFSENVPNRLRLLAAAHRFPVELLASIDGERDLEFRFHARFEASHLGGEWFAWSPELQATVNAIAVGRFFLSSLPQPKRITHPARRDLGFVTDGYRYTRSVRSRIDALHRRGLPVAESIWLDLRNATASEIEAAKLRCEPIIAAWQQRYPSKTAMRRRPAQFRHLAQVAA